MNGKKKIKYSFLKKNRNKRDICSKPGCHGLEDGFWWKLGYFRCSYSLMGYGASSLVGKGDKGEWKSRVDPVRWAGWLLV